MQSLNIKLLSESAVMPTRGSQHAAGLDLYSPRDIIIPAGGRVLIRTGIAVEIPHGYYGQVAPRSGLALKYGIDTLAGVIDSDYRGEIGVMLLNTDRAVKMEICAGDRIAQLITIPIAMPIPVQVSSFSETSRGASGYGSTGK